MDFLLSHVDKYFVNRLYAARLNHLLVDAYVACMRKLLILVSESFILSFDGAQIE